VEILATLSLLCPEVVRDIEQTGMQRFPNTPAICGGRGKACIRPGDRCPLDLRDSCISALVRSCSLKRSARPRRIRAQTGDSVWLHCLLLMDRTTFDALLLAWLGQSKRAVAFFGFMGATMTMETIGRRARDARCRDDKVNLLAWAPQTVPQKRLRGRSVTLNKRALERWAMKPTPAAAGHTACQPGQGVWNAAMR